MENITHSDKEGMQRCPCGTGKIYSACCGVFISNQKIPSTPEALMRSRYTAYSQVDIDYILHTMKSPAADHFDSKSARDWAEKITWIGLEIIKTTDDGAKGMVEFCVSYEVDNQKHQLHERSEFHFEHGKWYYVDGIQLGKIMRQAVKKIGRNDDCPCGSHKKYKKCCGNVF